jgi:NADH-quinone oxidoreductase subunit N
MVLVFSMIINSVIGLYYYLRVINALFSTGDTADLPELSLTGHVTLALISISILVLGIYPGWLIDMIVKYAVL